MAEKLLSGTVTFLFTDIEGSTRLLSQLRERYGDVLADHERILREAFDAHGGHVVDTQGDSFFAVFPRARDAVAAALAAQRAIGGHHWPESAEVRVRMGLHTGEPVVGGERYVGLGVHRAARVGAAAHGGQILLSNTTRELVEDELPPDIELRDLGEHALKDLPRPERLYQLVPEGLPTEFPPPRTAEPQPFAGRESELAEAAREAVPVAAERRLTLLVRRPPRALMLVAAAAVLMIALAVGFGLVFRGESSIAVRPGSVVKIDPAKNKVVDSISVGGEPGHVRVLPEGVFVTSAKNKTLTRIDPRTGELITSGEYAAGLGLAAAGGELWVASESRGEVTRVSPRSLSTIERIKLARAAPGALLNAFLALGGGSLWVSEGPSAVTRWSLRTHGLIRRYELGFLDSPVEITFGDGAAWVGLFRSNELLRIDAATGATSRIAVGTGPTNPVLGFGSVWVSSTAQGTVWRIDSFSQRVEHVIPVGGVALGLTVGAGSVWVTDYCLGAVARIDPKTNEVAARIETGHIPRWLAFGAGHVWVGVAEADIFDLLSSTRCRSSRAPRAAGGS